MIKLGKSVKTTILFCSSIVILFTLCIIIIIINFFTKDSTTKETIVGINPVSSTKSTMMYQEPLTVILDNEEEKTTQPEENIENAEELAEEQILENQENLQVGTNSNLENQTEHYNEETKVESEGEMLEEVKKSEENQESIVTEYNGFKTIGKIEIPQTGVNIPILNQVTVEGMKNAPCLLYATGELNKNGNNLIVGHNYRNGTIFSNNKNLNLGDKIYITTLDGNRVEYTIYNKFITTAEDVSYIKRDTNNKPEITLSCCTDDDEYRIIILARVE